MNHKQNYFIAVFIVLLFLMSCDDGKKSWERKLIPGTENQLITSVDFFNTNKGVLITSLRGNSGIYLTNNGGDSWQKVHENQYGLHDIITLNDSVAIAVGNDGILKSADTGSNWEKKKTDISEPLLAVDFNSEQQGLAVGKNGTIIYSLDGGNNWKRLHSESSAFLKDVTFADNSTAFAVGSAGTILKTENKGQNWSSLNTNYRGNLTAVSFFDLQKGIAVGENGTMLRTVDGGSTWKDYDLNTKRGLLGIDLSENSGIVVGFGGTIIKTIDGGESWEIATTEKFPHLYDVSIFNKNSIIIVGEKGTILKGGFEKLDMPS